MTRVDIFRVLGLLGLMALLVMMAVRVIQAEEPEPTPTPVFDITDWTGYVSPEEFCYDGIAWKRPGEEWQCFNLVKARKKLDELEARIEALEKRANP